MVNYNEDLAETFDNKPDEITEKKIEIDANFSTEDLLAIIAEIDIDNHELIKEIKNSNEMEGIAFNSAEIDDTVVVIIGKKLLECTAKLRIESYEKVTFITIKDESRIYVVPVKTNVGLKNSLNIIINPATEDKQDDIIDKLNDGINVLNNSDVIINPATEDKQDEIINNSKSYTTLIDDYTTINKTYIGKAIAGSSEGTAVWQIKCLDETGNFLKIRFAGGVSTFIKEWDNRVGYTYT